MKEIVIPKRVKGILERLESNGYEAYIVGGCVRDLLLGASPTDWDITTSATPKEICESFKDFKLLTEGERFGTIGVADAKGMLVYEITTFRTEEDYLDGRHPGKVSFAGRIDDDLSRRDFTVNGMAFSEKTGLIDLFGGKGDLEAGIIKAIGNPKKRFKEDGLRIIRAMRFAAELGFCIENEAESAIYDLKDRAKCVAKERLSSEFEKLFLGSFAEEILNRYSDVLKYILGVDYRNDVRLNHLPRHSSVRIAALMPGDFSDLKLRKRTLESAKKIYKARSDIYLYGGNLSDNGIKTVMKNYGYEVTKDAMLLAEGDVRAVDRIENSGECYRLDQLEITGRDLYGLSGREIGEALDFLLDLVICGKIKNDRKELVKYASAHFVKH